MKLSGKSSLGSVAIAGIVGLAGFITGAIYQSTRINVEIIEKSKAQSFKDGMNEGKAQTVDEIKKFTNFYFAITSLSYYIARCDGSISKEEQEEIDYNLNTIKRNVDIPDSIKNELVKIIENEFITFEDVEKYLDGVSVKTLKNFLDIIDDIIMASDGMCEEEAEARAKFFTYLKKRSNENE